MNYTPKLFLYSLALTPTHFDKLETLAGKKAIDIRLACIENATDIIEGSEHWVPGIRQQLIDRGYQVETMDLRSAGYQLDELNKKLKTKDVIWVCGGHTYYLRWILKYSGADKIIQTLVAEGIIYAGWSAGAIMAGPTTKHFQLMGDDPAEAPELIEEGLHLTDKVIVPHMDNPDFANGAAKANAKLLQAGFKTIPLNDNQAYIIESAAGTII